MNGRRWRRYEEAPYKDTERRIFSCFLMTSSMTCRGLLGEDFRVPMLSTRTTLFLFLSFESAYREFVLLCTWFPFCYSITHAKAFVRALSSSPSSTKTHPSNCRVMKSHKSYCVSRREERHRDSLPLPQPGAALVGTKPHN